jgi:hypothetical protein
MDLTSFYKLETDMLSSVHDGNFNTELSVIRIFNEYGFPAVEEIIQSKHHNLSFERPPPISKTRLAKLQRYTC